MKIRKGDPVVVVGGAHQTSDPHDVVSVEEDGRRIVVEGINRAYKHVKRGHPKSPQGGRLQIELPIDASNVMYYCPTCSKPTRLGYRYTDDGAKERYCRHKECLASAGTVSPPKSRYAKTS
ncbi:50S ribosomal protein L24 [Stratiformator vulcanicus]|uniref:Large ribosomal subunit protein uL24 n=1 Tax=Stratiformator vulcanicus TaxID=2527980 RepID=A0A517R0Z1_9PLAN|nr:50S ribosomal protein L24 [Stratiformator vulcanicus]QDT37513.1 50S ribosomal protein L24 [Stratiformator vulcanicus]